MHAFGLPMVLLISVSTSPSPLSVTFLHANILPFVPFVVASCVVLTIYEKTIDSESCYDFSQNNWRHISSYSFAYYAPVSMR